MIPYGRQHIGNAEVEAVVKVMTSDFLTTGPLVEAFEEKMARYCGAAHAVAVSNGTAALHIAVLASGIETGDEGITSPNTFLASANCMAYSNVTPQFADIDPNTFCIDPQKIRNGLSSRTRLIIPVHFAGQPCEMPTIWEMAKKKDRIVIEDAAHALGSSYIDRSGNRIRVGSCTHSHMTIFSFHPVKTITTGEGGMITTNDAELARKCRLLRNHGMEKDPDRFTGMPGGRGTDAPWYYEMQELGYNYRLTDIQCALGLVQMDRLDGFVEKRRRIWQKYNDGLAGIEGFETPCEEDYVRSAWHLYVAQTRRRDGLLTYLRENGIGAHAMYIPVHLQPWYRRRYGYQKGDFPCAENYFDTCLVLPLYPDLTEEAQDTVIRRIRAYMRQTGNT